MSSKKPLIYGFSLEPLASLQRIEQDPDAFTMGRRNDDCVNWFLAKVTAEPGRRLSYYISEFETLVDTLSERQRRDLLLWDVTPAGKITTLYHHYANISASMVGHYWIDIGYPEVDFSRNTDPLF